MKLVFIEKGTSKRKKKTSQEISRIQASEAFSEVVIWPSEYAGHTVKLAKEACGQFDYVISVGGDGTLNEVVNGCMQAKLEGGQLNMPIIGVLPQGTANDFVKTLCLSGVEGELDALIQAGSHDQVDVGQIAFNNERGERESRYFINIADVGIGAKVVQNVNASNKILGANLTFLWSIVKTFLTFKPRPMHIKSDNGLDWKGDALLLAVGNAQYYGSGLCITPHAKINDGVLGVTLMGGMTVMDFILRFAELKKPQKVDHPEMSYHEAKVVEVDSSSSDCAVEADGEFLGYTPLKIEILPGQLSVLMPQ